MPLFTMKDLESVGPSGPGGPGMNYPGAGELEGVSMEIIPTGVQEISPQEAAEGLDQGPEPVINDSCYLSSMVCKKLDELDDVVKSLIKVLKREKKEGEISKDVRDAIAEIKGGDWDFVQKRLKILFDLIGEKRGGDAERN